MWSRAATRPIRSYRSASQLCATSSTPGGPTSTQLVLRRWKASITSSREATMTAHSATTSSTNSKSSTIPIVTSLLAAAAGVVTVSAAAAAVEMSTADRVPPYSPSQQRFDQSHFAGRFNRMLLQCDPRLLLYSQAQVLQAKELLEQYENNNSDNKTFNDRALWEARRLVESALNDQGNFVPPPFRMSGYVAFNGPVCVAMVASQSTAPLLFWSWVNQSQNALVNYYNRNTSSNMTNETLIKSYAAAVGAALLVAFGLATAIQKKYSPQQAQQLLRWVAFPSAVVASSLNCYIVRSPEIETGIPLETEDGRNVVSDGSTSQIAAARGVYSTTASRAILQAPVYFVPPLLLAVVGPLKQYLLQKPQLTVPVTTYLLLTSFGVGLPATTAIFPQKSQIAATDVEERFQHLRDPLTQQPYQVFYYNKGL